MVHFQTFFGIKVALLQFTVHNDYRLLRATVCKDIMRTYLTDMKYTV